ncbi:MAG: hypothetical protein NTZ32_11725 [Planctomycetales bacterium]|nr:hypothetical protein [Planctomycetales bacterium]
MSRSATSTWGQPRLAARLILALGHSCWTAVLIHLALATWLTLPASDGCWQHPPRWVVTARQEHIPHFRRPDWHDRQADASDEDRHRDEEQWVRPTDERNMVEIALSCSFYDKATGKK